MDPQKVQHEYESGYGSGDGVDPHHTHIHSQTQNQLRLDVYGAEDESGDGVDPPISSGWTEVEPDMELIPLHLRLRHIWD